MSLLDSLSLYTASQKAVAYGFMSCGVVLLIASLAVIVFSPTDAILWRGFKFGSILFGMFILAGGYGYLNFSSKIEEKVTHEYHENSEATLANEKARIKKVNSDYPMYQIAFSIVVIISLVAIVFAKPFWAGFAFPAAFLFVAILLIEAQSKVSIDVHTSVVESLTQQNYDKEP